MCDQMMFLILCFQAILASENMLQRIDRHVWLALPKFSFFVCRPRFIDILAGFVGIRYDSQTLFVVINIFDIFYANCE